MKVRGYYCEQKKRKVTIRIVRMVVFAVALVAAGPTLSNANAQTQFVNKTLTAQVKPLASVTPQPQVQQAPAVPAPPEAPPAPAAPVVPTAPDPSDHQGLMQLAGIDQNDWAAADWTVTVESSWNPYAREPSTGACGLAQELPCGKSGCSLGDEVCELRWMNSYVMSRYGSWWNEVAFHKANNYY